MVVGEHVPLAVDDEAGARRRTLTACVDLDRDDAGQRHGGDVGDRTGRALRGARPGFGQSRAGEVDAVLRELTGDAADDAGEQAQADHHSGQPAAAATRRARRFGERARRVVRIRHLRPTRSREPGARGPRMPGGGRPPPRHRRHPTCQQERTTGPGPRPAARRPTGGPARPRRRRGRCPTRSRPAQARRLPPSGAHRRRRRTRRRPVTTGAAARGDGARVVQVDDAGVLRSVLGDLDGAPVGAVGRCLDGARRLGRPRRLGIRRRLGVRRPRLVAHGPDCAERTLVIRTGSATPDGRAQRTDRRAGRDHPEGHAATPIPFEGCESRVTGVTRSPGST